MKNKKVLIFAAHPDDEVLGCGGTIAYHRKKGDTVGVCYLSEGVSSRFDYTKKNDWKKDVQLRKDMAVQASSILDFQIIKFLDLPNLRMEDQSKLEIVKKITNVIEVFNPQIVYVNFPGDLNTDHQITFKTVFTALRPHSKNNVRVLRCYEVLSSTEWSANIDEPKFNPDTYVDVTNFIENKMEGINAYLDEMRPFPHPRSKEVIYSLMRFRGSQVGFKYSEAFVTVKNLII